MLVIQYSCTVYNISYATTYGFICKPQKREKQFPSINEVYFKNRAGHVLRELKSKHIKGDLPLVLVDVEIYDYILDGL